MSNPGDDPGDDPLAAFAAWLSDARAHPAIPEPNAMVLASVDDEGKPSARVVLLRGFDARGFVFYTNLESRKGDELLDHRRAALCFWWQPLGRQARVEGKVFQVDDTEADAYFAGRPRESQIGAWASDQSRPIEQGGDLERRVREVTARFEGQRVPRPRHWSGLRVVPEVIELWQEGTARLHRRDRYARSTSGAWERARLYP